MPRVSLRMLFKRQTLHQNGIVRDSNAKEVKISVIFTRLGEIDTMNEKFSCEATIFASWLDDIDSLQKSNDDQDSYYWDPENHWDPQLYIDNAIGEVKEKDVKYHLEKYFCDIRKEYFVEVNMIKRIQGVFFEKLELYHFPFDVQDLSLRITSHRPSNEVYLTQDLNNPSKVTKHASLDKHIWKLHEHVNIKLHTITNDFHFNGNELMDNASYSHAAITIQCRVSRKPGYFVVNCLLPTLMITICVFFTFLMDYDRLQYRFSLLFTTMLTSITFRWSIHGRVLPTVSYLTFLDMYCISSILIVFSCMVWHSIFAQLCEKYGRELATLLDTYAMWTFVCAVIVMHLTQTIWFFIAFHKRHELDVLDKNAALDHYRTRTSLVHSKANSVSTRGSTSHGNANANVNRSSLEHDKTRKIYYSFSKLHNSSVKIFKVKKNEKQNFPEDIIDHEAIIALDQIASTSNKCSNCQKFKSEMLQNIQFSLSANENIGKHVTGGTSCNNIAKNSIDSGAFNNYHYTPLIQQPSKDSKDEHSML